MGIFDRVVTLVKSNINELLDRAEDPEKMIKQMILEMEDSVREGKIALAAAITEEKKLKAAYEQNEQEAQEWYEKAELALKRNEEDLAREALKRRKTHDENAQSFKTQWETQRTQVSAMREQLDTLESKVSEAKAKKDILIARKKRAEASKKINEQMAGIGSSATAFETFNRMEEKIGTLEAQADAAAEVNRSSLDERFAALDKDGGVDDDLAALKAKLAQKDGQ